MSWTRALLNASVYLSLIPLLWVAGAKLFCSAVSEKRPWRERRVFPFIPVVVGVHERQVRKLFRSACAANRVYGPQLETTRKELMKEIRHALGIRASLFLMQRVVTGFMFIAVTVFTVIFIIHVPNDPGFTARDLSVLSFAAGTLTAVALFMLVYGRGIRQWYREASDAAAIELCADILSLIWVITRGGRGVLDVGYRCSLLRQRLGDFAEYSGYFFEAETRKGVLRHVAAVQKELATHSDKVMKEGEAALPGMVEMVSVILDRLIAQRWLGLLDVATLDDGTEVVQSSVETDSKRDGLILIGGSAVAAFVVGIGAAMGAPVAALMPVATMFMLGPAMMWGGRKIGVSPRIFLDSMRDSMGGENGATATPRSSEGAGDGNP